MKDYLILVIDSSSVEAIIAGKSIFSKTFKSIGESNSAHLEHTLISTLTTVLQEIVKRHSNIKKIDIILTSPWIVSKTKTSHFDYAKTLMIDKEYLSGIILEERNAFRKIFPYDVEFVEQKVFETRINGYNIRLSKPSPAISLTVSSAMSAMSKSIVKKITDTIEHFFHGVSILFHSSSILTYISMRNIQPEIDTGVFLNVHGECTDVTIFKNGIPTHFASVNYGSHTLIKRVSQLMKTSEGISESKISIFENSDLSSNAEEKVSPLIEKELNEWSGYVFETISQLEEKEIKNIIIHCNKFLTLFSNTITNLKEDSDITNIPDEMNILYTKGIELVEFHK